MIHATNDHSKICDTHTPGELNHVELSSVDKPISVE